jgi:hypothetical protein
MTDAPLGLPTTHTVLRSFAGHLEAGPDAAYARLADWLAPGDETGDHFLADRARRLVVVQGNWWYRGEYRVLPEGTGSRVAYEIINVAQFAHWAGAWTARSAIRAAPAAFQRLLTELEADAGPE